MFIFNMVQHTKNGDVVAPALSFETEIQWKAKYHQEMSYAIANEDILGIDILISNEHYFTVFSDNLTK